MKISHRLILGFSSLVAIFSIFGGYIYISNQKIDKAIQHLDELYEEAALHHIPSLDYSLRLLLDAEKARDALYQYVNSGDRKAQQLFFDSSRKFEQTKAAFLANLKQGKIEEFYTHQMHEDSIANAVGNPDDDHDAHQTSNDGHQKDNHNHNHDDDKKNDQLDIDQIDQIVKKLEVLDRKHQALYREELKALEMVEQGKLAEATLFIRQTIEPKYDELDQLLYKIEASSRKELKHLTFVDEHLHSILEIVKKFRVASIVIIGLSIILAAIISFLIIRSISNPILKLRKAAEAVGQGELDKTVDVHSKDELGVLANAFNQMSLQLSELYARLAQKVSELENSEVELRNAKAAIESENLRMSTELEVTRRLQEMILPKAHELNQVNSLDIAGFMQPATEVGGDYYDVLQYDGRVKIGIGDVTGHGLESGVLMLMVQTAVRTLLESNLTDPHKFLSVLNRVIYDNVQRMNSDKNLTLSLLDYQSGKLSMSGQHEELLVVRSNGQVERIDTLDLGFPIGLVEDIAEFVNQAEVQLSSGDGVVLYTDGITEAESSSGHYYGLERLCQIISQNWHRRAHDVRQAIVEDVHRHIGEQKIYDDITLLILKQK